MELYLKDVKPYVRFGRYRIHIDKTDYNNLYIKTKDSRLFYVISGKGGMEIEGVNYSLGAGSVVLFRGGTEYRWDVGNMQVCIVNFDYTFSAMDKGRSSPILASQFNDSSYEPRYTFVDIPALNSPIVLNGAFSIAEKVKEMVAEIHINDDYTRELVSGMMKNILISIARMWEAKDNEESGAGAELAKRVVSFIQTHFSEEINNEIIAEELHYNSSYLSRVFKKYTGKTMHGFLLEQRLENAKEKLKQKGGSVYDAAISSGFTDMPHFSKIFKKQVGQSPAAYRQYQLKKNHTED